MNHTPFLYIDTMNHLPTQEAKQLERKVLREDEAPNPDTLSSYLTTYCRVVGTDEIMLKMDKNSPDVGAPKSYLAHREKISEHLLGEPQRECQEGSNSEVD